MRSLMSTTQPCSATPGPGYWAIGWLPLDVERRTHQSLSDLPAYRKPVHPLDRWKSGFPSNRFQKIESALSAPDRRCGQRSNSDSYLRQLCRRLHLAFHLRQADLSVLIRLNAISCVAIHILQNAYCVFQHSVKPTRQKRLRGEQEEPYRRLLLLPKYLTVGLAIGIKAIMFTAFPSGFQFGSGDVPVRTAFPQHNTQVLPKLFDGRPAKKPVAVVDLEYNETRFEDDDMRDHRIVLGVRVLGDVEILLNLASRIGQKGPMSADAGAVLIRRKHVVGTDSDQAGVTNFHLVVKLDQALGLAQVLRAVSSAAKHRDHGIWPL